MQKTESGPKIFLSEPYAADLLLYLLENESMMATDLRNIHSNDPKIVTLCRSLSDMGILEIEVENRPRMQYSYRLTEKGKLVAEKLKEIEGYYWP
jgi:DNA-binding MarR family transcriptional regulator